MDHRKQNSRRRKAHRICETKQHRGERLTDRPNEKRSRVHLLIYMYIHFVFSSRLFQHCRGGVVDPGGHFRAVVAPATLALLAVPVGRPCLFHETHTVAATAASLPAFIVVSLLFGVGFWRAAAQRVPPEVLTRLLQEKDLSEPVGVSFFSVVKPHSHLCFKSSTQGLQCE